MGRFLELGKCEIAENKNIVVSIDASKKISIAQQLVVNNEGTIQNIFLKNAINVDADGLKKLYALLGEVIKNI